jgi:hypothetical protein
MNFNYETSYQSSKRIVRIGQTEVTSIHRLFFIDTIQMLIEQALNNKSDLRNMLTSKSYRSKGDWKDFFEGKLI